MPIWHVPLYLYPDSACEIFSQAVKRIAKQRKGDEGGKGTEREENGRKGGQILAEEKDK